jgi:microsomal dipeptidase-like Zn-dependent dipeptidase
MKNKYADLHLHTTSKFFFQFNKDWKNIKPFGSKKFGKPVQRSNLNRYHQSDPIALNKNKVDIAHLTLLAGERADHKANFWLFKLIVWIITGLSPKQSTRFYKKYKTYFQMLLGEIEYAKNLPQENFKLVQNTQDLNDNRTKVFLNVEGFHCFNDVEELNRLSNLTKALKTCEKKVLNPKLTFKNFKANYIESVYNKPQNQIQKSITENCIKETEYKLFSIGASHFEYNYMLGQAWAIPIPKFLRDIDFFSALNLRDENDGLSNAAKELLIKLHKGQKGNVVLFDIKHASLKTRMQYYQLHDDFHKLNKPKHTIPIICSHTGVSGYATFSEAAQNESRLGDWKNDPKRRFNRWPINICDDDIRKIYASKGIIGIMVDRRLLGHFQTKFGPFVLQNCHYYKDIKNKLIAKGFKRKSGFAWSMYIHGVMFLENIFHIVNVVGKKEAWNIVCFGSDFDGNIKPIDCCPTYNYIEDFRLILSQLIDEYFIEEESIEHLLFDYSKEDILNKFFYENLNSFTKRVIQDFW